MKSETQSTPLSRREALRQTVLAGLGMSALTATATEEVKQVEEVEYVPENDYPFFGYEPTSQN
jgi:hypothetical protein